MPTAATPTPIAATEATPIRATGRRDADEGDGDEDDDGDDDDDDDDARRDDESRRRDAADDDDDDGFGEDDDDEEEEREEATAKRDGAIDGDAAKTELGERSDER